MVSLRSASGRRVAGRTRFSLVAAALLLWNFVVGGGAQANTITVYSDTTLTTAFGVVSDGIHLHPPNTFQGFIGVGSLSPTQAAGFVLANSNPGTEAAFLNSLAGTSFSTNNADYPDDFNKEGGIINDGENAIFSISGLYFGMKIDGIWAFFKNESGGTLSLTWEQTGKAAGLSHYFELGVAVPGPIVGAGLPGLLLACGGLLLLARRRRLNALAA